MSKINISDLHKKQLDRKNIQQDIFDNILNKCYNRIKLVSERSRQSSCFFQLPQFVFGVPIFNSNECAKFIINKLVNEGFIVVYTHPNLFYISWDIEYTKPPKPKIDTPKLTNNVNNFRQIEDYKPSGNFLKNIKNDSSVSSIEKKKYNDIKNIDPIDDYYLKSLNVDNSKSESINKQDDKIDISHLFL